MTVITTYFQQPINVLPQGVISR